MSAPKRILIAPLNWGLGHASRCIPIIQELIRRELKVVIAADGAALKLLMHEFPEEEFIQLEDVKIRYPKKLPFSLFFALKLRTFQRQLKKEHAIINYLVEKYELDGIISDNRYGLYSENIPSVIITHQLFIQGKFLTTSLHKFTADLLSKFKGVWVPDFAGKLNLSGQLSHTLSLAKHVSYIGPLSRFSASKQETDYNWDLIIVLSGPEPQRSILERKIIKHLKRNTFNALLVRGVVEQEIKQTNITNTSTSINFLGAANLEKEIKNSRLVLCRAAYSSVMDLVKLQKKAILIPTKGQTEQEYLSDYIREKKLFYTVKEDKFNLQDDYQAALKFEQNLPVVKEDYSYLDEFIKNL